MMFRTITTSLMPSSWFAAAVFCIGLGTGVGVTAWGLTARYDADIAALKLDQERKVAAARADDIETLKLAHRHGDALTLQLQASESTLTKKEKELQDAIRTQTTGRACLSSRTVSLLNNAGSADGGTHLPTPAASPAAADGAAASDTDVAEWIDGARHQYDTCRSRLQALIEWWGDTQP